MKKVLLFSIIGLAVFAFAISASAAENWRLSGDYTITFTCTSGCGGDYVHTMNVSLYDNNDGTFSGTGYYNVNPSITWSVAGDVTGDTIEFSINYNGSTYYVDADGTIAMDGTMSGTAVSATQAFNWAMSPNATFNRYAEITSPEVDEVVYGEVEFTAFLIDNDYDPVSWAVRKDTCNAATNTVFGNVDGHHDTFTMTYNPTEYKYSYSATADTCEWEPGAYCFVFNPTEDGGEAQIRLTRWFVVDSCDEDGDGVNDGDDMCPETIADGWTEELGINRWMWDGEWQTEAPDKKKGNGPDFAPSIEYTYGCSCEQILDKMVEVTGFDFGGHYKFGCSKSILEDWNRGNYHVGPTFIETVEVLAVKSSPTPSTNILESSKDYFLEAHGTAWACQAGSCNIEFDAEYSNSDGDLTWDDGVAPPYNSYGPNLLDLEVDGNFVDWGAYDVSHVYQIPYAGTGSLLSLLIYDIYYPNNTGSLFVDLIEDKWVDLW